jgi:hypothetical protein
MQLSPSCAAEGGEGVCSIRQFPLSSVARYLHHHAIRQLVWLLLPWQRITPLFVLLLLLLLLPGIAIGGDTFPGSTLSDHCIRYQNIPQVNI